MKQFALGLAAIAFSLAAAAPALALEGGQPLSKSQVAKLNKCKKLTPAAARKNATCVALMKVQADAMMSSGDAMMSSGDAMKSDDAMMSSDKPKAR